MRIPGFSGLPQAQGLTDSSGVPRVIEMKRSTTKDSKATDATVDQSDTECNLEMCQQQNETKRTQGMERRRAHQKAFIRKIWIHLLIAMIILMALITIFAYVISVIRSKNSKTNLTNNSDNADTPWYSKPHYSGDGPIPTPTNGLSSASINDHLSAVLDMSLLQNNHTALGRAYLWVTQQDEKIYVDNARAVIQRFTLAALYFATGGGRTSATWDLCSAVPTDLAEENVSGSTQCVMDDGVPGKVILCANDEAFIECNEYYSLSDLLPPEFPKRRWLSKVSECDWYGISCDRNGIIEEISLPGNGLVGTLLPELDLLTDLKTLDLTGNALTGELPEWIEWKHMQHILLSGMSLEGPIPDSWQYWNELATLFLDNNDLKGAIALPGEWMQLYKVSLANNRLDIELQPEIGDAVRLSTLDLAGNVIDSTIPESLSQLEGLLILDLSECGISGTIPESLWQLSSLQVLRIGGNDLSGSLSENVGNLHGLVSLSVAGLKLTANIPTTLGNLVALEDLQLQQNAFTGLVPEGICQIPGLVSFWADCAGKDGLVCACCTDCCDPKKGVC